MIFDYKLYKRKKKHSGRNNKGVIVVRHKGGGKKLLSYITIDYRRNFFYIPAIILTIKKKYFNKPYIAKICYINGIISYINSIETLKQKDIIISGNNITINKGNSTQINYYPISSLIHNIQTSYGADAKIIRSSGMCAKIIKKTKNDYTLFKVNKKKLFVNSFLKATLGVLSNKKHKLLTFYKAGQIRLLNRRPSVRGVAMNPIDHPHGGGQGKTSGGRCSVTPWGVLTKGFKTLKKRKRIEQKKTLLKLKRN